MACHQPMAAWQTTTGGIIIGQKKIHEQGESLLLPCGKCLGCRLARAQEWALRCRLELNDHPSATFTTLTYDDKYLPPTLSKRDLQLYLKRLRKRKSRSDQPIRFFGCGEYGSKRKRPHYHLILYGLSTDDENDIDRAWDKGFTQTTNITPRRIAYTCGYVTKKQQAQIGDLREERVDPDTGEVYIHQPPFIQMSRVPGIGATARDKYHESWRDFAIRDGGKMPVPRYLHEGWKTRASAADIEQVKNEKMQRARTITYQQIHARAKIQEAQHSIQQSKRNQL